MKTYGDEAVLEEILPASRAQHGGDLFGAPARHFRTTTLGF